MQCYSIKYYLCLAILIMLLQPANCLAMASSQYQIEAQSIELDQGQPSDSNAAPISILNEDEHKEFQEKGYSVRAIDPAQGLTLSLSQTQLTFENTDSSLPQKQTVTVKLDTDTGVSYRVLLAESTLLANSSGSTIPNTRCDRGDSTCNSIQAATWTKNTAGLGYSLNGPSTPVDFRDSTYFRSLADLSQSETPKLIMHNLNSANSVEAAITFKLVTQPNLSENTYQNTIFIITNPNY